MKRSIAPEVITLRRRSAPASLEPETIVETVASAPERGGWVGLRGGVEAVFRAAGAKVWGRDEMVSARPTRRVAP